MEAEDIYYMQRAIQLADKGIGWVNPNPLVGAVIVKEGKVIGEGWHERYGGLHAERNAFKNCTESPDGATLYVTLEPCCHYGKTPPCTAAVIENKIARLVVGMTDPNPLVAGNGVRLLQEAGIEVTTGILEKEIQKQNRIFIKYITTQRPWVIMKTAMTLDGKIAAYTGDSRWVTGLAARQRVQELRCRYMGIMVGIGTVMADDPLLNCRLEGEVRQPVRVIADSRIRIFEDSQLVRTAKEYRTILAYSEIREERKAARLSMAGIELIACKGKEGRVDLEKLMELLGKMGIDSILLEGGGELNESFLKNRLVDEVYAFIAPKMIGGKEAKTPVEGKGGARMSEAILLHELEVEKIGNDILINALVDR